MNKSAVIVNRIYLILGILSIVYYLGCGITVRFGQSLLFMWLLLGVFCIGRWFLWKRAWKNGKDAPFGKPFLTTVRILLAICLAFFLFVEGFIFSSAFTTPTDGLDAIVVLGARVEADRPSGSLSERIGAAAEYLSRNPDTVCVASGGQGEDEPMSEAQCIFEYLTAAGIAPERILIEDRSTSTVENLRNSFALLGDDVKTVGIVTNDFHVFRAMAVGRKLGGFEMYPVPARSVIFGYVHYAMREFFAICVAYMRGNLAFA